MTKMTTPVVLADTTTTQAERARRYVASQATDPADARDLLEALGLIDVSGRVTA